MPRSRAKCQICNDNESKYTCSACFVLYCSVPCYRTHKEASCAQSSNASASTSAASNHIPESTPKPEQDLDAMTVEDPTPLRPLTSLKWPYVPEESAYPDPLKRDDPKPLQPSQYEAVATSKRIRTVLEEHPNLPALLTSLDQHRGPEREQAIQRALAVTAPDIAAQQRSPELSDDVLALRALAEAVEAAVRGSKEDALGLNWGE